MSRWRAGKSFLGRETWSLVALVLLWLPAPGEAQTTTERPQARFVVPIARIDRTYLKNEATVQGTITSYKPSWRETAPHSFVLSDGTGNLRIAVWPNVWEKIPFKEQLKQEGQEITARVTIAEFRGALEGHLDKADQIWLGLAAPELAKPLIPTSAQTKATMTALPLNWKRTINEALEEAKKTNKNIVILFANPESDNGRYVEEKIFGDQLVRASLAEKLCVARGRG